MIISPQMENKYNDIEYNEEYEEFPEEFEDLEELEELEELQEEDLLSLPPNDAVVYKVVQIQKNQAEPNEILTVQQQIDQLKIGQIKKFYPAIMQLSSENIIPVLYAFSKHLYAFSFGQQKQLSQLFEHLLQINLSEQNETYLIAILVQFFQLHFQTGKQADQSDVTVNVQFFKKIVKNLIMKKQVTDQNCKVLQLTYNNLPEKMQKLIIQYFIKQLTFFIQMNQKGKAVSLFTTKTKSQKKAKQLTVENKLLSLQTFNYCKICWSLANKAQNYIFPLTDVCLEIFTMLELKQQSYCFILQLADLIIQNSTYYTPLYQFLLKILQFILQPLSVSSLQVNLKIYSSKLFEKDGQSIKQNLVIVPQQFPETLLYKTYLFDMWKNTLNQYLKQILNIKQQVFPEATNAFLYQLTLIINEFYQTKMNYKEFQRGTVKNIINELKEIKKVITEQQNQIIYQRGKTGKYQNLEQKVLYIYAYEEQKTIQQQKTQQKQQIFQQQQKEQDINNTEQDIVKPLVL